MSLRPLNPNRRICAICHVNPAQVWQCPLCGFQQVRPCIYCAPNYGGGDVQFSCPQCGGTPL
ncbi:MAG: hypothetical protein ACTSWW_03135 [Promethearchaeota archaeon]